MLGHYCLIIIVIVIIIIIIIIIIFVLPMVQILCSLLQRVKDVRSLLYYYCYC